MRTPTIDLKGKAYATVPARIKEFREQCPNGLIETLPTIQPDGKVLFKARILKDKSDQASAEATGHAIGDNKGEKAFEKLETIAVGRALALLGFMASGDIASGEEMAEFYEYQNEKREEMIREISNQIESSSTIEELKKIWKEITADQRNDEELKAIFTAKKNQIASELNPA